VAKSGIGFSFPSLFLLKMSELSKAYQPGEVEENWYARWSAAGAFRADESSSRPAYSIVIPPPNVTGILHLGHVLNNTIQDILARRARMQGHEVLWLPGTDHAGIATQTMVEKDLRAKEGKTRRDVGRDVFLGRIWDWKEKHGGIIINQLKRLGCSCDWSRERFTMDADYSHWVSHVFAELFRKGLIYRGKRMVNWCPASLTALSDEEVIAEKQKSKLYTMRYEVVERPGTWLEISTTRPETLMGDTGVAVHPDDDRYRDLVGLHVWRPFPRVAIPIVADAAVEKDFGTGCLKVTPAHDKVDFEIGIRHGLEIIDVLNPDGTLNAHAGPEFEGMERFKARRKAAEKLAEMELLVKEEDYENNVFFSERARVPVEPRLSMQWFLRYPSVPEATRAVADGSIAFRPDRWAKTYAHWMENIQDWCISRQLWWGHRIPVWYRKDLADDLRGRGSLDAADLAAGEIHVGTEPPAEADQWVQDEDVLDTWFSSWLWPFATMTAVGVRSATLQKFHPTTDLVTGPDIIFFWVARMIMAAFEFEGTVPFRNVYFTSIIRDKQGRKMSKTLGNSPDPLDLMAKYGADGLRFGLLRIAPSGQDVKFDEKQIEEGRNFANKLWNACRFRLMQGDRDGSVPPPADRGIYQIDILAKLDTLTADVEKAYGDYQFNAVAQRLYEFFWSEYCDWFLESVKADLQSGDPVRVQPVVATMDEVLSRFLRLLHPYMPHITEELWETLGYGEPGVFLMHTPLPEQDALHGVDPELVATTRERVAAVFSTVTRARHLKAEYQLGANRNTRFHLQPVAEHASWIGGELPVLRQLCGAAEILLGTPCDGPAPRALSDLGELAMPLEGLIDLAAEATRLTKELAKTEDELKKVAAKLGNETFVSRANPEIVQEMRDREKAFTERGAELQKMIASLRAG